MARYNDLSYQELRSLAKERGLKFRGTPTKATLLDRLRDDYAASELGPLTAESIPEPVAEPAAEVVPDPVEEAEEEESSPVAEVGHDEYIGDGPKRFRVQLKHMRPLIVAAADETEAWDRYRDHLGVLATDHRPDVVEV